MLPYWYYQHITGGGEDYTSGPYSVRFAAGRLAVALNILINDDNELEGNENFNLIINSSLLPSGVMVGYPGLATVTIADHERKL